MLRVLLAVLLTSAALVPRPAPAQSGRVSAREVIRRIQADLGVPWQESTVDTFKTGDPDTPVTGIAVTMMSTLDVLERAVASGKNLIITHEPTFYQHYDRTDDLQSENDPVFLAKQAFIRKHKLIIWRIHDHWHARRPDGMLMGVVRALGWERYQEPAGDPFFTLPSTTLGRLSAEVRKRLGAGTARVIGDPQMKLTRVAVAPGFGPWAMHRKLLQRADVEALVIGEAHEWEAVAYVADAVTAKQRKALIVLGHVASENPGMEELARWLKPRVKEVPVEFLPTAEPFRAVK